MVKSTFLTIYRNLGSSYDIHKQTTTSHNYFVVILTLKASIETIGTQYMHFKNSMMGRGLLGVKVKFLKGPSHLLYLATAHFESCREYSVERQLQLTQSFDHCARIGCPTIFGGDLNLRDNEVKNNVHSDFADVWETCGRDIHNKFTWDTLLNDNLTVDDKKIRCRFDRLYCSHSFMKPSMFTLIGKERIPLIGRFPSDHFGILASFNFT